MIGNVSLQATPEVIATPNWCWIGDAEGRDVGMSVGDAEGCNEGRDVGMSAGDAEGRDVAMNVGLCVEVIEVGLWMGAVSTAVL